jgi:hypothetical protein
MATAKTYDVTCKTINQTDSNTTVRFTDDNDQSFVLISSSISCSDYSAGTNYMITIDKKS